MALIYYTNTKILFAGAILRGLGNATSGQYGPFTIGMTIYSGVAPAAAAITASWATYNSSQPNYLVHFTNATWGQPASGPLLNITGFPTAQTPVNNGTASWAILWSGAPTAPQLASVTLPFANFLVVSASDPVGDGVLRFASTAFTTGSPVTVLDGSIATNL